VARVRVAAAVVGAGALLALLGACASTPASPEGTWGSGGDGEPQLVLEPNGVLSGTDGCNRLMGSWQFAGGTVEFGEVATTLMACEGVDTWLAGLSTGRVDGATLRILDADGVEIGSLARR